MAQLGQAVHVAASTPEPAILLPTGHSSNTTSSSSYRAHSKLCKLRSPCQQVSSAGKGGSGCIAYDSCHLKSPHAASLVLAHQ
jgi:hypothetical protein